jgi:hypothetical protein
VACISAVLVGPRRSRVQLEGRTIVGDGTVEIAKGTPGVASVYVGVGMARVEEDGRVVVGDGSGEVASCGAETALSVGNVGGPRLG